MTERRPLLALCIALLPALTGGCKVLTIEEDRARRTQASQSADPQSLVEKQWNDKVLPTIEKRAISIPDLTTSVAGGIEAAGEAHGRQASEGSPWTFALRGSGSVIAVDRASQRGTLTLSIPSPAGARSVQMQIGPFVSGTAIRDALDFIAFNDFKDQLAYADIGNALTARALKDNRATLAAAKPGDTIAFLAVANIRAAGDPILLTPVRSSGNHDPAARRQGKQALWRHARAR